MAPARLCKHPSLQLDVSPHAAEIGFIRLPFAKRVAAATPSGRVPKSQPKSKSTATGAGTGANANNEDREGESFPGPLILPNDALAIDEEENDPQSLLSWIREEMRNPFTQIRKTTYVVSVPTVSEEISFMRDWVYPTTASSTETVQVQAETREGMKVEPPQVKDVLAYLAAFYHPLPVKIFPGKSSFVPWSTSSSSKRTRQPNFVGLHLGNGNTTSNTTSSTSTAVSDEEENGGGAITRIRTRACPDGAFPRQLNLNDILDGIMEALPADAYAVSMMVEHDLYEDEEDDFCCGRAYGNSRVSVVSTARYHPALDEDVVDRWHMWPASHCRDYVERLGGTGAASKKKQKKGTKLTQTEGDEDSPIRAAITAAQATGDPASNLHGLWFSRVARTISHEIGHCLCLAHCPYYACVMQSTAGMAEDVRQPPYLCPVCLAKVSRAIMQVTPGVDEKQFVKSRYLALQGFCEGWLDVAMFAGFHAWLGKRIEVLDG